MKIKYIHEPNDLQCGQAVLAMLTGIDINRIIDDCETERETKLVDMKRVLLKYGFILSGERRSADTVNDLPEIALLSLETPRCWHWSLYAFGTVYDPEHGILKDFPVSNRKYYWEVLSNS